MVTIRPYVHADRDSVVDLWRRCGLVRPNNDPFKDIARKLKVRPDLFLVALLDNMIVGAVMIGYEGHRGWINYLGVCPNHRRRGIARQMMDEAERLLRLEGCPKINLQVPLQTPRCSRSIGRSVTSRMMSSAWANGWNRIIRLRLAWRFTRS